MAPCIEILKFTATDAYKADPSILDDVFKIVSQASGCIAMYSGPDVQEPQYGWVVGVWESLEQHQALAANKEGYSVIKELLGKVFAKIEFMNHVNFSGDVSAALAAPFTELASWDVHAADTKQFLTLQAGLIDKIHELSPKVLHKGGWGTALENERKVFICLGWDDLAEFKAFIGGTPALQSTVGQMKQLADVTLSFATLKKYERK